MSVTPAALLILGADFSWEKTLPPLPDNTLRVSQARLQVLTLLAVFAAWHVSGSPRVSSAFFYSHVPGLI